MKATDNSAEARADQRVDEALHELGDLPLDEIDEYADQLEYAGCYPWIAAIRLAHPHDPAIQSWLQDTTTDGTT
jgi:hypothetical protein